MKPQERRPRRKQDQKQQQKTVVDISGGKPRPSLGKMGKRRAVRQTQKKTQEGNILSFATFAIVGNKDGYIGLGHGKSKETIPAREKAMRKAKLNIIKIRRGCGSWE